MEKGYFGKHLFLGLLGVIVALLPCELALRLFYLDQYPPYSYLEKHKRFLVNGQEATEGGEGHPGRESPTGDRGGR